MKRRKGDGSGPDFTNLRRPVEHPRRPRRILMIEPSRVDRLLVSTALTLKGRGEMKVTEVADLDLGLSLLLQRSYDLVLLDDAVPGQSFWDTTRAIRGVAPTTPVIFLTQYLEGAPENGDGLDQLVEAVEAALPASAASPIRRSFAWAPWCAASAAS